MPSISSAAFKKLGSAVQNHQASCVNGVVVVITLSSEEIFKKVAFQCPCSQPKSHLYGGCFLWAPALVLFILGILINTVTWRLFHGCIHRAHETSHGFKRGSYYCIRIIAQAVVAPSAWLFVSLLDGSYYVCMVSQDPCNTESQTNKELLAESQIIGWFFLVFAISSSLIMLLITRCTSKFTFVQSRYIEMYQQQEKTKFDEYMKERVTNLATSNIKSFFDKDIRMKIDWDAISVAPLCHVDYVKKPKTPLKLGCNFPEPYFTPLHKWANEERRRQAKENKLDSKLEEKALLIPETNALCEAVPSIDVPDSVVSESYNSAKKSIYLDAEDDILDHRHNTDVPLVKFNTKEKLWSGR
ncbi:calcium homeostasis modulator protein 6-like isoform X1 [Tachypleus tridentatus]|uniref:calcium homeostasis modulator protein 6-like isoform X1 n=1 Tax=Tachypleus tridentatus TaxID=6853 RepID=UPI003FD23C7C